jgi:hypothetical protein
MDYIFSAASEVLRVAGKLVQVTTNTGQLLPILRDPATGRFVEIASGVVSSSAQSFIFPPQLIMSAAQMYQTHQGFTSVLKGISSIQDSLSVLQASTALIGVGTFAGVALSAVNLHQTLQLREDVRQLRLEVKDGFIDLKKALASQGTEIIQRIDAVAQDIKFEQHRLELIKAYGRFLEATKLMKTAMSLQDMSARKIEFANARQTLGEALASYNKPHLLSETCAAGQLRRMECAWAIEQAVVMTYQLQDEPAAVSDCLSQLQTKIRQDILSIADRCGSQAELDFLYPEIKRIHDHDLIALESWQNHVDWVRSLSQAELLQLQSVDSPATAIASDLDAVPITLAKPPEQILYEEIKPKSHFQSLRDQLKLMFSKDLRQKYEAYVGEQALASGHKALEPTNLKTVSEVTVANLYWYFKSMDMEKAS